MEQHLHSIIQYQTAGMKASIHDHCNRTVCRRSQHFILRFNGNAVPQGFGCEHLVRHLLHGNDPAGNICCQLFYSHIPCPFLPFAVRLSLCSNSPALSNNKCQTKGNYDHYGHCNYKDPHVLRLYGQDSGNTAHSDGISLYTGHYGKRCRHRGSGHTADKGESIL